MIFIDDETQKSLSQAFRLADKDKDGFLTKDELKNFFKSNNEVVTDEELNQVFMIVDVDPKDEKLSE